MASFKKIELNPLSRYLDSLLEKSSKLLKITGSNSQYIGTYRYYRYDYIVSNILDSKK